MLQHSVPYVKQELLILKYNAMYVNGCVEHRVKQFVLLWTHLFKIKIGKALGLKNWSEILLGKTKLGKNIGKKGSIKFYWWQN